MGNKSKNYVYYELNTSVVEEILLWLSELTGEKDEEKESKKYAFCKREFFDRKDYETGGMIMIQIGKKIQMDTVCRQPYDSLPYHSWDYFLSGFPTSASLVLVR